jgi:hypothetical protein
MSPWQAGWINLKAMFVFGADFFFMVPGMLMFFAGLVPLCLLAFGPVTIAGVTLSLNGMLLGLFLSVVGLQLCLFGVIAKSIYDGTGLIRRRWLALFDYTRTFLISAALFAVGSVLIGRFVAGFAREGYQMTDALTGLNHQAIFGLFLAVAGILTFGSMLLIQAVARYIPVSLRDEKP